MRGRGRGRRRRGSLATRLVGGDMEERGKGGEKGFKGYKNFVKVRFKVSKLFHKVLFHGLLP